MVCEFENKTLDTHRNGHAYKTFCKIQGALIQIALKSQNLVKKTNLYLYFWQNLEMKANWNGPLRTYNKFFLTS